MKLGFLSKSRGLRSLVSRIFSVARRFGVSPKKFERRLKRYFEITRSAGCVPTFAITAAVLARHPECIQELSQKGVEFAVHGYVHIDYQTVGKEKKREHFKQAMHTFEQCRIPFAGFRAPFLRTNEHTTPVLGELAFLYNSSRALLWPIRDMENCTEYTRKNLDHLLEFYQPLDADKYLSLPRLENGLVEIPVSIPDDELIVERLGIIDEKKIGEIWLEVLEKTYNKGELFNFSLHPERIEHGESGLREMLRRARELNPPVWIATLKEIAEWWQERSKFAFDIKSHGEGRYRVKAECSERATVLVKNGKTNVSAEPWFEDYQCITSRDFVLESPGLPVIGVKADSSGKAVEFLQSEGYIIDLNIQPDSCAIYLDDLQQFDKADEKALAERIERSNAPLVRFWRWPDRARSALSITGDIDSITMTDFVLRILENKFNR